MDSLTIIEKYFPALSEKQKEQLAALGPLFSEWNEKINVISRKDIDYIYERHILHALSIAKFKNLSGKEILDVGTGGGFPGIPLAILFPDAQFTLVDSTGKKITVVKAVAEAIGLENLTAQHERAEKVKGTFDFVVGRAVTRMNKFVPWVREKIDISDPVADVGIIALKGGDLREEMAEVKRNYQEVKLSDYYEEEYFETKKIVYIPF
jgi:16S rRNA (guanine527-N7)-methyltransferase